MYSKIASAARFVLLASTAAVAQAQTQTADDQLAEQFMPPAFTAYAASHTYLSDSRSWRVLPVDLDHTGRPDYLAVAYGNGHIAYLRVIRKSTIPTLAGESGPSAACDSGPSISAVDLDNDGRPELELACRIGNAGNQFSSFFKWSAGTLVPLNPPSLRRPNAWEPIREPNFVDLDGSGVLAVLAASCTFTVDNTGLLNTCWDLYRLDNGRLTKSAGGGVAYFERFNRYAGKPATTVDRFAATPGRYVLTIANGERGQNLVSSGAITLNGTTVASPNAFSKNARVISADVTLAAQNTLSVELSSSPGSFIHVLLTPEP